MKTKMPKIKHFFGIGMNKRTDKAKDKKFG